MTRLSPRTIAATWATLVACYCSGNCQADTRPNIVIIVADDLGWNDVSYHGGPIPTPNIDRLGQEGVELDRFYVCPYCSPTRAGLMTGRYPHRFGMHGYPLQYPDTKGLPPSEFSLPEMLRDAGYANRLAVGKWHLGNSSIQFHPLRQGFTGFYGHYCGMIGYFSHRRGGQHDWHRDFEPAFDEGYATELISAEAVRFVRMQAARQEPFFLYLSYNAVHTPNQATPDDLAAIAPAFRDAEAEYQEGVRTNRWKKVPVTQRHESPHKRNRKDGWGGWLGRGDTFFAMTRSMDRGIGELLDALDSSGARENTLVWFLSDNGGTSNNYPLRGRKGRRWDGGVRVPAVVRWPDRCPAGRRVTDPIAYIDLLPTIAAAVGFRAPWPKQLDGINALPWILGDQQAAVRTLYLGKQAVTTGRWKLVEGELYDLVQDPRETTDVAAEHPQVVVELQQELDRLEKLSGPACRTVGPNKQEPPENWVLPDIEIVDPNAS